MYYKSRKLSAARKRMKAELLELGWTERECRFKPNDKIDIDCGYQSPHIDDDFFWYEQCLKKINPVGEAYFALETFAMELEHLAWQCNDKNPNNHHVLDTLDAFGYVRKMMLHGIDFDYYAGDDHKPTDEDPSEYSGHIKIIDWEHPERNTFEFVEGWRGALNDGFAWDIVLFVNAIPVGGIVLEADPSLQTQVQGGTNVDGCQRALDVAQYQLDNDYQFPVYCHALILSNGKQILSGDPWMELEDFTPINSLADALKPLDFLKNRIENIEEIEDKD